MIQYYTPHMGFKDIARALLKGHAEDKTIKYFQEYTGKKYVLLTSSCRMALYLAYQSVDKKGEVIVSPLTCKSAIDPILWSGNTPVFSDISPDSLNMEVSQLDELINEDTAAIQIVHHGGVLVPTENLIKKMECSTTLLIEDCAQSFGATINGAKPIFHGDIICFSLIKNAYGIGGGILATNSEHIYNHARKTQNHFNHFPILILLYRLFFGVLESKQKLFLFRIIFKGLKKIREHKKDNQDENSNQDRYLYKPNKFFFKLFVSRIAKMEKLQKLRKQKGSLFFNKLITNNLAFNYKNQNLSECSFTKLFIYHPSLISNKALSYLIKQKVKAKHLEQRDDGRVQKIFTESQVFDHSFKLNKYPNYLKIHDALVSLPLTEDMTEHEMDLIIKILKETVHENDMV